MQLEDIFTSNSFKIFSIFSQTSSFHGSFSSFDIFKKVHYDKNF